MTESYEAKKRVEQHISTYYTHRRFAIQPVSQQAIGLLNASSMSDKAHIFRLTHFCSFSLAVSKCLRLSLPSGTPFWLVFQGKPKGPTILGGPKCFHVSPTMHQQVK